MTLDAIHLYTLDVKGGKVLEVNDLTGSGIRTLDNAYQGDFICNVIVPDMRARFSDRDVVYLGQVGDDLIGAIDDELKRQNEDWNGIIISGFCGGGTGRLPQCYRERACVIANAGRLDSLLYEDKRLLGDFAQRYGIQQIAPMRSYETNYYETNYNDRNHLKNLAARIRQDFSNTDILVIKPAKEYGGTGVVIIDKKNLEEELHTLFVKMPKNINAKYGIVPLGFSKEYWAQNYPQTFLVQEFMEGPHVQYKKNIWDGTRRYVGASIVHTDDRGQICVDTKFYGGFIQLPREPVSEDRTDTGSRISFSYGYNWIDGLVHLFGVRGHGHADKILLNDADVQRETLSLAHGMNTLFHHFQALRLENYLDSLGAGDNPEDQILKRDIEKSFGLNEPQYRYNFGCLAPAYEPSS